MDLPVLILVATFLFLLVLHVPIVVSIAMATFLTIVAVGTTPATTVIAQRMVTGIDSFPLLAIPLFILSGLLMGHGGMARRLIDFASALFGRFPGGLGYVNVLTCMLFGSISGSATAAVSSIGGFMIPEMERKGYGREFGAALTITAATTGLLIPPSNIMIVYALVAGGAVSIAAMFMAGVLPGIVFGVLLMAASGVMSYRNGYGAGARAGLAEVGGTFLRALPSMFLMVIILGGILSGLFTPTEAAAVAVFYAFVLGAVVYRQIRLAELPGILLQSGVTTAVVMMLIGTSQAMSWILSYEEIPQAVSVALLALSDNPLVILLVINFLLLAVGTFMDMTPAVLIFTPIFLPVAAALGMHPIHFGIMMIANLCIGLCTPPVGTCLFVGCSVGQTTLARVTGVLLPFFLAMVAALMLTTYVPALSMWLPRLLGLS